MTFTPCCAPSSNCCNASSNSRSVSAPVSESIRSSEVVQQHDGATAGEGVQQGSHLDLLEEAPVLLDATESVPRDSTTPAAWYSGERRDTGAQLEVGDRVVRHRDAVRCEHGMGNVGGCPQQAKPVGQGDRRSAVCLASDSSSSERVPERWMCTRAGQTVGGYAAWSCRSVWVKSGYQRR
jgi:hypothetical protein